MNGAIINSTVKKGFRPIDIRQALDHTNICERPVGATQGQLGAGAQGEQLGKMPQDLNIRNVAGNGIGIGQLQLCEGAFTGFAQLVKFRRQAIQHSQHVGGWFLEHRQQGQSPTAEKILNRL